MTLDIYLSIFTLIFISLGVNFIALKIRVPNTVLLVIAGSLLVPLSKIHFFSFLTSFQLTPELLFFIFLPVLIFESAYNINFRNISDNKIAISMLSVVGLLISTFFIGYIGHWGLHLLGFEIPLLVTLLFGAIISATDPVAVLALFKEYGTPRRLTLIFEGESLFNDGTAFALFLVLLELMVNGYHGYSTILNGILAFTTMILGGIVFGLFMGFLFSKMIEQVKGNEHLEITLTLLVAHFTFILSELISYTLVLYGQHIHISSIIATMVASLVMGNYGRFKMSANVEQYMGNFWEYFAFLANSLVFMLMGILFTSLSISLHVSYLPIFVSILVVVIARAVSVYLSIGIANQFKSEAKIPIKWQHLLAWGSLRGSLAVIMVLLIPDDLTLPNWPYEFSIKEFIIAITIGSIYFTLLVKATTIGKVIRWLNIDALVPHEQMSYYKSKALIYLEMIYHIKQLKDNHHISKKQYDTFTEYYREMRRQISKQCSELTMNTCHVVENMLRIYTLGIQKKELKELFRHNEISESIYKKNLNILETQTERIERDDQKLTSLNKYSISRPGRFVKFIFQLLFRASRNDPQEPFLYYRTQYQLINKVLDELYVMKDSHLIEIFDDQKALQSVIAIYQDLRQTTEQYMQHEIKANQELLDQLNEQSAKALLRNVQEDTLKELHDNKIITNKLYIVLNNELNEQKSL